MNKTRYAYFNGDIYVVTGIGYQEADSLELALLKDYFHSGRKYLSIIVKLCNCDEITNKQTLKVLEVLYGST